MDRAIKALLKNRISWFRQTIEAIPLDRHKKKQLQSDFILNLQLMETLANRNLLYNDFSNIIVIILSALVPVLINYDDQKELIFATVCSVLLAIFNAFRQSYKFRDRWQNYRRTAELLVIEGQNFFALSGAYAVYKTHDGAFPAFIHSISKLRVDQMNEYTKFATPESDDIIQKRIEEHSKKINGQLKERALEIKKKLINEEINAMVRNMPEVSYHEVDHERKLVKLYLNEASYSPPEKIKFQESSLSDLSYKISAIEAEVTIQGVVEPSSGIRNAAMSDSDFGSTGCLCLQSGNVVLVTCYHVVKHADDDWSLFVPGSDDEVITTDQAVIGTIIEGEKTLFIDAAIVALSADAAFEPRLPNGPELKQEIIYIDDENYKSYQEVYIISRIRGNKKIAGKLAEINKPVTINYGTLTNKDKKNLEGLLLIHQVSTEPFSLSGDSGSIVFTNSGEAIGMIVAGDGRRASFAIPFSTISERFNLSIL